MKILVTANDNDTAKRAKDMLDSFGKGMHIFTRDDGFSYYGCVICIGKVAISQEPELFRKFDEPVTDEDWERLEKELWTFYRDYIKDSFGTRCSCGLFEFCHCH